MRRVAAAAILLGGCAGVAAAQVQPNRMNNFVWVASSTTGLLAAYETSGAPTSLRLNVGGTPIGVAVAANGHVFAALNGTSRIFHVAADGSAGTFLTVGKRPYALAVDGTGTLWVTDSAAPSFYQVSPTGTVLRTFTPGVTTLPFQGGVAVNRFHQVWVANGNDDRVYVYDALTGKALSFSPVAPPSTLYRRPTGVAVDRVGHCWVAYRSGGLLKLDRTTGTVLVSIASGNPAPVAVAINNFNEVYVANGDLGRGTVTYYNSNGALIQSTTVGEALFGIAIDGNGDVWVTGTEKHRLYKLDRWNLNGLMSFPVAAGPLNLGDFTGYVQANIFHQGVKDDFDGDGYRNAAEVDAGTNPFDPFSTPRNPRPVLTGLARVGSTVLTNFRFFQDATLAYAAAAAFNRNGPSRYVRVPGTSLVIPLEHDGLYDYAFANFWVFQNYQGWLDANGDGYGQIALPKDITPLVGTTFYVAFVTLDGTRPMPITTIANNVAITIRN